MAIAVLISSAAEAACFTAIGLDLAARLDTPVLFLCLQAGPTAVKKKPDPGNSKERVKSKPEKSVSSAPTESAANPSTDSQFLVSNSYLQETRQAVAQALGTMAFGYVATDTVEIPNAIDDIRKWLVDHHESPNLGHFDIETLVIPTLRGPGLEKSRTAKELLFECSQVETVLVSVDQSLVDPSQAVRLPLNNIGIMGQSTDDILNASRFARRFSHVEVRRLDRDANEPQVACAIMAIPGKAQQTRIDNNALWKSLRKNENIPLSMVLNPADSIGARVSTAVDDKLRHWFSAYQLSREDRIRLSGKLEAGAASSPEFILFMSLATFLACVGLIQDSAAVIIGAMLVAPLMVPLLGAGLAMIFGNRLLFAKSLRSIMLGVGLAFAIGTLVGLFSLAVPEYLFAGSGLCLTNEMIAQFATQLAGSLHWSGSGTGGWVRDRTGWTDRHRRRRCHCRGAGTTHRHGWLGSSVSDLLLDPGRKPHDIPGTAAAGPGGDSSKPRTLARRAQTDKARAPDLRSLDPVCLECLRHHHRRLPGTTHGGHAPLHPGASVA